MRIWTFGVAATAPALCSTLICAPAMSQPALVSPGDWVNVAPPQGSLGTPCVDRNTLRRDGSWVFFNHKYCGSPYVGMDSPSANRVNC